MCSPFLSSASFTLTMASASDLSQIAKALQFLFFKSRNLRFQKVCNQILPCTFPLLCVSLGKAIAFQAARKFSFCTFRCCRIQTQPTLFDCKTDVRFNFALQLPSPTAKTNLRPKVRSFFHAFVFAQFFHTLAALANVQTTSVNLAGNVQKNTVFTAHKTKKSVFGFHLPTGHAHSFGYSGLFCHHQPSSFS